MPVTKRNPFKTTTKGLDYEEDVMYYNNEDDEREILSSYVMVNNLPDKDSFNPFDYEV